MDLWTLLVGAAIAAPPLVGAGLLAAIVFLERPDQGRLAPANANASRRPGGRSRRGKARRCR